MKPASAPRAYRSPLRAEQARRTREKIVAAARTLFTGRGYAATSIRAVAESAGVVPETVYDIFGTKRALLEAVVDSAITGGTAEPEDWLGHSWVTEILALASPHERLTRWIRHTAATLARTSPVHAIIRGAAESDRNLAGLYRRLQEERFAAHRRLIEPMTGRRVTGDEAETFSALTSPELHHLLTVTQGWTQQRYTAWLEQTVTAVIAVGWSASDRADIAQQERRRGNQHAERRGETLARDGVLPRNDPLEILSPPAIQSAEGDRRENPTCPY